MTTPRSACLMGDNFSMGVLTQDTARPGVDFFHTGPTKSLNETCLSKLSSSENHVVIVDAIRLHLCTELMREIKPHVVQQLMDEVPDLALADAILFVEVFLPAFLHHVGIEVFVDTTPSFRALMSIVRQSNTSL